MSLLDNDEISKAFGVHIRRVREAKKLRQWEVAAMLGITQAYYSLIERGEREIGIAQALNICTTLDIDFNAFVQSCYMKKPRVKRPDMKNRTPE